MIKSIIHYETLESKLTFLAQPACSFTVHIHVRLCPATASTIRILVTAKVGDTQVSTCGAIISAVCIMA